MDKESQPILYTCSYKESFSREQMVEEHVMSFVQSGAVRFQTPDGPREFQAGEIFLIRRNHLAKTTKIPDAQGNPVKSITIFITQAALRHYAAEHNIAPQPAYAGPRLLRLSPDALLEGYFRSLLPYDEHPHKLNDALRQLKINEAIELLLLHGADFQRFLFDFSEPHKIDLEAFMLQNFEYNIPLKEFARLSGRSLSTFKRDFRKLFSESPEKWLRVRRLEKAHHLLKEQHQKPGDVYLHIGFENLSHFSTAFKEHFGYNPSQV